MIFYILDGGILRVRSGSSIQSLSSNYSLAHAPLVFSSVSTPHLLMLPLYWDTGSRGGTLHFLCKTRRIFFFPLHLCLILPVKVLIIIQYAITYGLWKRNMRYTSPILRVIPTTSVSFCQSGISPVLIAIHGDFCCLKAVQLLLQLHSIYRTDRILVIFNIY